MLSVLASILLSIQPPISVKVSNVNNNTPIEKVGDRPVVFGIKETLEEILVDQGYNLDSNGMDVSVSLDEISSPQRVLNIIGLQWLKKDYIVTEVPLNKKAFSKALQKSLEDAMTLKNNINNQ